MFDFLGALICKFRPHKWSRAKMAPLGLGKHKVCMRCNLTRVVKTRVKP